MTRPIYIDDIDVTMATTERLHNLMKHLTELENLEILNRNRENQKYFYTRVFRSPPLHIWFVVVSRNWRGIGVPENSYWEILDTTTIQILKCWAKHDNIRIWYYMPLGGGGGFQGYRVLWYYIIWGERRGGKGGNWRGIGVPENISWELLLNDIHCPNKI